MVGARQKFQFSDKMETTEAMENGESNGALPKFLCIILHYLISFINL